MTWGEVFQYSAMVKKRKKARNLKEFMEMNNRINKTFYEE